MIWAKYKPVRYEEYVQKENKILLALERIGEVLVCVLVLIFSDFNLRNTYWSIWLIISFVFMLFYEIYWLRYFKGLHRMEDFYSSFLGIPVAGATLPVCAFFLLAIYGSNAFLLIAVVILGIGHIGIHLQHKNEVLKKKKRCLIIRILKWIGAAVGIVLALTFILMIGCRNINYLKHYQMVETGVDEGIYVSLGGMEQYVLVRSMDTDNPVIIYLHGGPSSPDTYATYSFSDDLVDEYTVIAWDQRGCGRTYFHNINTDPENTSVSFEQAKEDLDELVDYARERFGKEKVIILGHSYGTILGSEYALEHPDKVSAYIAAAQVLSLEETDIYSYEDALQKAIEAGDDTSDMIKAFEQFQKSGLLIDQLRLRSLVSVYHSVDVSDKEAWMAITSPYFGVDDFRWFFKQLDDLEDYISLNQQLFDYTMAFDVYNNGLTYEMPVYFISESCDWICPVDSVKEYSEAITAPEVRLELVEGCGHGVQYSDSEEFANIVRELLDRIK
jgi:pimeloyl-ACP methyl ester carboxylesterase